MKVYLVWCGGAEWEEPVLFKIFAKELDAEACVERERVSLTGQFEGEYDYQVTEEEVL